MQNSYFKGLERRSNWLLTRIEKQGWSRYVNEKLHSLFSPRSTRRKWGFSFFEPKHDVTYTYMYLDTFHELVNRYFQTELQISWLFAWLYADNCNRYLVIEYFRCVLLFLDEPSKVFWFDWKICSCGDLLFMSN
jgi:hypothetical protein